jgi:hypothetical protein
MLRPGYLRGRGDVINRRVMKPPAWAQQLVAEVRVLTCIMSGAYALFQSVLAAR